MWESRSSHLHPEEILKGLRGPVGQQGGLGVGQVGHKIHGLYGHRQMAGPRDSGSGPKVSWDQPQ